MSKTYNTKKSFLRSVVTVSAGTMIAQAVGILFQPVVSRLYTPSDMGLLANFMAITSVLAVIASGCYENAIVLPEKEKEANAVVFAGGIIAIFFAILCTIFCVLFKNKLIKLFGLEDIPIVWFYLLGGYAGIIGIDAILNKYAIRNAHYKVIARTLITQQIGNNVIKTGAAFFSRGLEGLFIGTIFSQIARVVSLLQGEREGLFKKYPSKIEDIVFVIKRYKKFPLVTSWSVLLNVASVQLPVIIITNLFSSETSGAYAMANRLLGIPMALVGTSIANVFLQKASEFRSDINSLRILSNKVYQKLLLFGAICMSTIYFWGDMLFPFFLGKNWMIAGVFSQKLSFWLLFVLVTSPLTQIYTILEKQGEGLIMNIILFVSRTATIFICYYCNVTSLSMITIYSFVSAALWFIQCTRIMSILKFSICKFLVKTGIVLLSIYGLQWAIFILIKLFLN